METFLRVFCFRIKLHINENGGKSVCYCKNIISLFALSLVEQGDHSQMEASSSRLKERLTSQSYEKEVRLTQGLMLE